MPRPVFCGVCGNERGDVWFRLFEDGPLGSGRVASGCSIECLHEYTHEVCARRGKNLCTCDECKQWEEEGDEDA